MRLQGQLCRGIWTARFGGLHDACASVNWQQHAACAVNDWQLTGSDQLNANLPKNVGHFVILAIRRGALIPPAGVGRAQATG